MLKNMKMNNEGMAQLSIAEAQNTFISKVFAWMTGALLITGLTSYAMISYPSVLFLLLSNSLIFWWLLLVELGLVIWLSARIHAMSAQFASWVFLLYSVLNGVTLSAIFVMYTSSSIATTFFVTAWTFAIMSLYWYTTKSDLTKWGNILLMVLIGIIIASIVNLFFGNELIYWITTYLWVIVFVWLIAYDTQKLKELSLNMQQGSEDAKKYAIIWALELYLDFINLFLYLLRIFGKRD